MSNEEQAKEIIEKILYITIATASPDGQPWNSPVYSAYDDTYNFYWASWKENVHSKNIGLNDKVFLSIYDSTAPEGTGRGVYVQARAQELADTQEIKEALALLYSRKHQDPAKRAPEEFLGEFPRRIYKAIPKKMWINSEDTVQGNFIDTRAEVNLI